MVCSRSQEKARIHQTERTKGKVLKMKLGRRTEPWSHAELGFILSAVESHQGLA